jgi:hypothetical protein
VAVGPAVVAAFLPSVVAALYSPTPATLVRPAIEADEDG